MERQRLKMIAIERIRVELERMMATNRVDYALTLLIRSELFSHINIASIFQQRLRTLTESDAKLFTMVKHSVLRWFTLSMLMNLSSSQCKQFFHSLTFPNKQIVQFVQLSQFDEQVRELLQHFATMRSNDSIVDFGAQWKLLSAEQGVEVAQCWLNWIISLFDKKHGLDALRYTNHRKQLEALVQHGLDWIDEMPIHSLGQLQVTGRDLLSLHRKGGPWVGHLLNELLDAVVSGKIPNEKKALMEFAKEKTGVIENE